MACDHIDKGRRTEIMFAQGPTHTTVTELGDTIGYAVEAQVVRCRGCESIVERVSLRRQYYPLTTPLQKIE
jgi:hypothetical protein